MNTPVDAIDLARNVWLCRDGRQTEVPVDFARFGEMYRPGEVYATGQVDEAGPDEWFPLSDLRRAFRALFAPAGLPSPPRPLAAQGEPVHNGLYRALALLAR